MDSVSLAKKVMSLRANTPTAVTRESVGELQEVFNTDLYKNSSEDGKREIMLCSSTSKYDSELEYPWDHYFGYDLAPFLKGKKVLDLGCFTGGRGIAWYERYGLDHITGIDVREEYIEAARQFAAVRGASADYVLATGEHLPFADESFDAILSFDVLEHVQDIRVTMAECRRVLKPNGLLYVVFPSYFQPLEHHLNLATTTPGLQWIFPGKTLVKAYYEVLDERTDSDWYRRKSSDLESWERGNTLNGITLRKFKRIVKDGDWRVVSESRLPLGSIGRNLANHRAASVAHAVATMLKPLTSVPGVQELVRHRITFVLQKTS